MTNKFLSFLFASALLFTAGCVCTEKNKNNSSNKELKKMFDPNCYAGTDSQRISNALKAAVAASEKKFIISARQAPDGRTHWLIDEAIPLYGNMEIIINDCKIKLSDACRDNFFRSANCIPGVKKVEPLENIRITGRGNAVLEGADFPRSSGDSGKVLGEHTYGTDAGKINEFQKGNWRNIGILMAYVRNFAVSNLTIRNYHCWGMSFEYCSYGKLNNIKFDTSEARIISGRKWNLLNQDGIDLRRGCHHIDIENISGDTGDDIVALTALKTSRTENGVLTGTEFSIMESKMELNHIHDVTIRNIRGRSTGGHQLLRLLNNFGIKIYNVTIENVVDTSTDKIMHTTLRIGDTRAAWGGVTPLGDTYNITIKNIDSRSNKAVFVLGSLLDSEISGVINRNRNCQPVECSSGPENMKNVKITDCRNVFD